MKRAGPLLLTLLLAAPARAAEAPAAETAAPPPLPVEEEGPGGLRPTAPEGLVPEASFRAALGAWVRARTDDGRELVGRLLAADGETATLALAGSGELVTLGKVQVVALAIAAEPTPPPVAESAAPRRARIFGVTVGLLPLVVAVDAQYRWFRGWVSAGILAPALTGGNMGAVSLGGAYSFAMSPSWRFELNLHVNPVWIGSTSDKVAVGIGVGMGFQYTAPGGFTLGFTLPIFGFAAGSGIFTANSSDEDAGRTIAAYYISALLGMPLFQVGYRF